MNAMRKTVLAAAATLFLVWMTLFLARFRADDADAVLRFVLGVFFALIILFRSKPRDAARDADAALPVSLVSVSAAAGTLLVAIGIFVPILQFEWLGLMLLMYACLKWALPGSFSRDIVLALFLLYWVHPLPGRLFGAFQFWMQQASIQGAEWILHGFNQRVWADGFVLHAGARAFGVPEACSGMRTAVTVLLCTLGVGVLFRLRPVEVALFSVLGVAQVLLLNMARIAALVVWAQDKAPERSETILHDTLWLFLLAALALVQAEMSWWKRFRLKRHQVRKAVEAGEAEPPDRGSYLPQLWTFLHRWRYALASAVLAVLFLAAAGYRRRPFHRAAMIDRVATELMHSDLSAAERAVRTTLALQPGNRERQTRLAHIFVLRGKYDQALNAFETMAGELTPFEKILKSWALMALDRMDEGVRLVEAMPPEHRRIPAIAIFLAEYAVRRNRAEEVGVPLVRAAVSHLTIGRVRALFPYLARHDFWPTIAACNHPRPFEMLPEALIAIEANLRVRNTAWAGRILKQAMQRWPDEPSLIRGLFSMAERRPGGEWEHRFSNHLKSNIDRLDADELAMCIEYAFRLVRPDLAWPAYRRLEALDASDPALFLAPARYGPSWFTFRKHHLGIVSTHAAETIDMRKAYYEKRNDPAFAPEWRLIPLAEPLASGEPDAIRRRYLEQALEELGRRERQDALTRRMALVYPAALALAGRFDEARMRLNRWAEQFPEERAEAMFQMVLLDARRGDWPAAYERARQYESATPYPRLEARLLKAQAMLRMNFGPPAMAIAKAIQRDYPDSPSGLLLEAAIWDVHGFEEEALFTLSRTGALPPTRSVAKQLFATGRYREAERLARALGVAQPAFEEDRPGWLVHPAERTVAITWPPPVGDPAERERALRARFETEANPFVQRLLLLEADRIAHGDRAQDAGALIKAWTAAGRDDLERGAALHRLALGLAHDARPDAARDAVEQALRFLPDSAVLWRMAVVLNAGDRSTVERARKACPDDPDLWLAEWALRIREDRARAGIEEDGYVADLKATVERRRFSPGAMVRLSDFLLRQGLPKAAAVAARDAQTRGQGMMSGIIMGLRCAWALRDADWARSAALAGADDARDPRPFHEMLVNLSFSRHAMDADLTRALEYLRKHFPQETEWSERLGFVYFQRGDLSRTRDVLHAVMGDDFKGLRLNTVLIAAETARLQGQLRQATALLEKARREYPDNPVVLNNLIYTLSQDSATASRAVALLPTLLETGGLSFHVHDTAAKTYLSVGRIGQARKHIDLALAGLDEIDPAATEVRLNAAEILLAEGAYERALAATERIVKTSGLSSLVESRARDVHARSRHGLLDSRIRAALALARQGEGDEARLRMRALLKEPRLPADIETRARKALEDIEAGTL